MRSISYRRAVKYIWDIGCVISVVGIWPRFIEPSLLTVRKISLPLDQLPKDLHNLRIAQFSDLHMNSSVSDRFLQRIAKKINQWRAHIVVYTGDFLCHAKLIEKERLKRFLNSIQSTHGSFCIFGNHDYESYVGIDAEGQYSILQKRPVDQLKGFYRMFCSPAIKGTMALKKDLPVHADLKKLISSTNFIPLENRSVCIKVGDSALNITGVGEYMANRFEPEKAFSSYQKEYPGVILAHNPDTIDRLTSYPGQVILCGHVHGGQVNLPWLRERFVLLENRRYVQGMFRVKKKWAYVNRGVGATLRFRLCAPPELSFFTLKSRDEQN